MDDAKRRALQQESMDLLHQMQTAIGFGIGSNAGEAPTREHKHLRVGINNLFVSHNALVKLLMEKGVFTEDEYFETYVQALREEIATYQAEVDKQYGPGKVTFH